MLEMDKNRDGVISAAEQKEWMHTQQSRMADWMSAVREEVASGYQAKARELEKELDAVRKINANLENRLRVAKKELSKAGAAGVGGGRASAASSGAVTSASFIADLSRVRVDEFVEELLQDSQVNCYLIPDAVERMLYRNMFSLVIKVLEDVVKNTSVGFAGHEIRLSVVPNSSSNSHSTKK